MAIFIICCRNIILLSLYFNKFDNPKLLKDWQIGEPLNNKLNKLKKSNPEAFFYWFKIYQLIKQAE